MRNRRIGQDLSTPRRIQFALGLLAFAFVLQFTTASLGSIDGYFHIRYSAVLRAAGWRNFPPPFPWLPLTILSPDRYFDHHWLFHWWLALFAGEHLVLGAKIAAALGAGAAFAAVYVALLSRGVRHAHWWTVATLGAAPGFLYRAEMPRVQAWSLIVLLIALHLILRQRTLWLMPLAWLYAWLYDAFPFLFLLCACVLAVDAAQRRGLDWRPTLWTSVGTTAGLLINPYFPHNLRFIAHHYVAKLSPPAVLPVGSEWHPPLLAEWLGWGGLLAALVAVAGFVVVRRDEVDRDRLAYVLVATVFLALFWRAARFVEYFVAFAGIALALLLHAPLSAFMAARDWRWRRAGVVALVTWAVVSSAIAVYQLRGRPPASRYAAAADWLQAHTPVGSLVFLTDWDDFPLLYFHDTANAYSMGLDPTYLAQRDAALFEDWQRLVRGEAEQPAALIRQRFGAVVAFADHAQVPFITAMDRDAQARRAFADAECIIYALTDSPG